MHLPLWLRSAASRPFSVLSLVVLSAMVTATAMLGPLLVRALHQAALTAAIERTPASQRTAAVFAQVTPGQDLDAARNAVTTPFNGVPTGQGVFSALRTTETSFSSLTWAAPGSRQQTSSRVTATQDGCAQIRLTAGECPNGPGQVLIATDDARQHRLDDPDAAVVINFRLARSSLTGLSVVGRYDPETSLPGVLARPNGPDAALSGVTGEPLIVTAGQLAGMKLPVTVTADLTLGTDLRLADEPLVRRVLAQVEATSKIGLADQQLFFSSVLGPTLDLLDQDADNAGLVFALVLTQAVAVALFALVIVVQRVATARTGEWTLGRLRGLPRWRWLRSVYLEPALALALGALVGAGAAALISLVGIATVLDGAAGLEFWRWPVLVVAACCILASVAALILLSVPPLRRPPIELLQQAAERPRLAVGPMLAQVVMVLVAAVSLYQLSTQDDLTVGRSRLGLLAPALLALAFGIIAVRTLVLIVRRLTRRPPRSRIGLLVSRRAARMPSSLNPAMVIAAGLALAVFSGQLLVLSDRNISLRADAVVGAPTVLTVARPATVDLLRAVDRADPTGRYAMAVQEKAASSDGGTARIVAVDATRFDRITSWQQRWAGLGPLRDKLRPGLSAPLVLTGRQVSVDLSDVTSEPQPMPDGRGDDPAQAPTPGLSLVVQTSHGWRSVFLGELSAGSHRYTAELKVPLRNNGPEVYACVSGCRLVSFQVSPNPNYAYSFSYRVRRLSTDVQPAEQLQSWLGQPGWHERSEFRPGALSASRVAASSGGLSVRSSTGGYGDTSIVVPGDTSAQLPVLLGATTQTQPAQNGSTAQIGTGLDGQEQLVDVLGRGTLPRALNDGVLADLTNIEGLSDPGENEATSEVWLSADAPPGIRESLESAGLRISDEQRLNDVRAQLLTQPINRGAALGVLVGLVAVALSLLTLAIARTADAARNRAVWRALGEAGQPGSLLRLLVMIEVAVPAAIGVVVGAGAGLLVTALASGRVPLRSNDPPGPPLDLSTAWAPVGAVMGLSVVVIIVIAVGAGLLENRQPGRRR